MTTSYSARTFRLFVSSTFSDFIAEREALQQEVFPELEKYCALQGARFQAVDLRWGITEEAQREHDTMRICLEEVRRCQQLSPRPNFAVLLGDRYGWEPVPARIPEDHWKRLMKAAAPADRELIKGSYRLDENAIPPVYCLHERIADQAAAFRQEAKLLQALRRAARGFRGSARLPYFASATHQEIAQGALSARDEKRKPLHPEQHVHVYVRHLSGLPQDESAKDFIDWDASAAQVIPGARDRLRGLDKTLRERLPGHVHDLHTTWSRHGRDGAVNKAYLKRFCDAFLSHQKALIDAEFDSLQQADERQQREQAHQDFGAERARVFAGRQALLAKIARYTETAPEARASRTARKKSQAAPLVLLGGGGSGKSALLARAAQESVQRSKRSGAIVLQRYIGGVPGTESLMTMLTALTADIASFYGQPEPPIPENVKALAENFQAALGHANSRRPLILYLDALDQLDKADSAWMLEWLLKELPAHVRVVTSVRTDTNVEQSARRRYAKELIEVPAMNPAEGRAMLRAWLKDKRAAWFNAGIAPSTGRRLTLQQERAVLATFNHTGSALWLKLAYEEAAAWASWDAPRQLPNTIPGLIEDLIDRRLIKHENHPKVFTERALAYLTAGRFGLSESELGRALGTDKAVRAEFQADEKTQKRWEDDKKLPPILWSRLFFDLQPYLGFAQADGALLMRWFHREFGQVLKARYLASEEDRMTIHGALADTFLELERELRPEDTNDDALFRATDASGKQVSAALRRVMEQPWQLAQAGKHEELQALISDFGFCMAKCAANRSVDLVADLLPVRSPDFPNSPWLDRLVTWNHLLAKADTSWPAHRILLQLVMEAPQFEQHRIAAAAWRRGDFQWPLYLKGVASSYCAPLAFPIRLPQDCFVFEDRLDSTKKGRVLYDPAAKTLKFETFSRELTNIQKVALIGRSHLLIVNAKGDACLCDIACGDVIQMGPLKSVLPSIAAHAVRWTKLEKDSLGDKRVPYSVRQVSITPGSAPFAMQDGKGTVILGSEPVIHVADLADSTATLMACDGNLFILYADDLKDLEPAVYSYLGEKLMASAPPSCDYERFGSIIFIDDAQFLSLGFQRVSGDGREDIKIEMFQIRADDVSKVGDIELDNTIDLPVPMVAGTKDGGVFLTCENYLRTFAFWPPFEQEVCAERVGAYWYRNERLKDRSGKPRLLLRYTLPYGKHFREEELAWVAEGPFGKWPSIHLPSCHTLLDTDESPSQDFVQLGVGSAMGRWYCDVPFQFAVQVKQGAVLVIRNTGPVMVRRATRSGHARTL